MRSLYLLQSSLMQELEIMLMEGNRKPHRAHMVNDFLFEEGTVLMEWSASFTDINSIERVQNILGRPVVVAYSRHKLYKSWKDFFRRRRTQCPSSSFITSQTSWLKNVQCCWPYGEIIFSTNSAIFVAGNTFLLVFFFSYA